MIINIISAYVVPLLKDINNTALIQDWKLNLDAEAYERNIDANVSKTSDKKENDCHDSDLYWPTTIKDKIQWFLFLAIMEHSANILNPVKRLITSLLSVLSMFELRLFDNKYRLKAIATRCIDGKK